MLQEASVEEENGETTTNKNFDLEAAGGKKISSQSSEMSEEVPLPSPPDGGWGWVIVFACFMCNLVISKFLNIYYSQILTKLEGQIKEVRGFDATLFADIGNLRANQL